MKRFIATLAILILLAVPAYADTDGTEPVVTNQPNQLVLQLGVAWAGSEFELRTDAGVFPAPVIVDELGILRMDLGGSAVYTLALVSEATASPSLSPRPESPPPADEAEAARAGLPPMVVVFFGGLALAIGGLVAMQIHKKQRKSTAYDEDFDDDE